MVPEIYQAGHSDFSRPGIPLTDAYNVVVKPKINTAATMNFQMLRNSRKWRYVRREAVVRVDGQLYIIKIISDGSESGKLYGKVECKRIWWERVEKKHIPHAFYIGKTPAVILNGTFSGISYASNAVRLLTDAEVSAMGLTPVTAPTDIDIDRTNPLPVLSKIIENTGGEVYIDNFRFALVKQLGRETDLRFSLGKNLQGIERTEETTKLVTRLYPYGKDGLEISSVNGGVSYIDSPYINDYEYIHEGYIDYKDIETPAALWNRAWREFSPEKFNRIDIPKLSYKCSVIDLWKASGYENAERLELGDTVIVHDANLDIDNRVRVTEYSYYPYETQKSSVTLGDPPETVADILADISNYTEYYYNPAPVAEIPEIADVVENITENVFANVENSIDESVMNIFETKVLVAETAMIMNAWIRYLCVGMCETNFEALDIRLPAPKNSLRHFIRMQGIRIDHIEAVLSMDETEGYKTPYGDAIYWTETEGEKAYKYFTITDPSEIHRPDIPEKATEAEKAVIYSELREKYRVKVRKTLVEHVKKSDAFEMVKNADGSSTIAPKTVWWTGDGNGNGRGYNYKNTEGFYMTYTTRTSTGDLPAGTEIGIRLMMKVSGTSMLRTGNGSWSGPLAAKEVVPLEATEN